MFGSMSNNPQIANALRELMRPIEPWRVDPYRGSRGGHNKYHMPKARRRMRNKMSRRSRRINRMRGKA